MNTLALLPYSVCSGSPLPLNVAWSVLYNEIFITRWYFHIWFTLRFLWNLNFKTCVRNLLVLHLKRAVGLIPLSEILFCDLWRLEANTKELISSIWNSGEWHFIWDCNTLKACFCFDCFAWVTMKEEMLRCRRRLIFHWFYILRKQGPEIIKQWQKYIEKSPA